MSEARGIALVERPQASLARTLAEAFQDDPALTWIVPDPAKRARALAPFFQVSAAQSARLGRIWAAPGHEAAALWYPPGAVKEGAARTLLDNVRFAAIFRLALLRGLSIADAIHAHHPDPQPFWYLRYVGVRPEAQGKGWGGAIVRAGIEYAAERGCGVLLETATPANVEIYKGLGFEVRETWQAPQGGPLFWTMVRSAS